MSNTLVTVNVLNNRNVLVSLNLKDRLSYTRKELERNTKVDMNTLLSFAKKGEGDVIERDKENETTLEEIIDSENKILYLKEYPRENFNRDYKLGYGYIINDNNELDKANTNAFEISDYKIKEDVKKYTEENHKDYIEITKISLSFKLKPTPEFVKKVRNAVKSKKLDDIINEYGVFISEEIILGGQIYFVNSSKSKYKLFVGGRKVNSTFNETEWTERLNDLRNWDCIKLINPVHIFKFLPDKDREDILSLVGKKVIYTNIAVHPCKLNETGKIILDIPEDVLKIFQNDDATIFKNDDARCRIFATVIGIKEKKAFFNSRISHQEGENPKLIIHYIQRNPKDVSLKIRWMVIGYDINFGLIPSSFAVRLEKLDVRCTGEDDICKHHLKSINNPSVLCFGIPELSILDTSNGSLVIGHHFFDDQENKIGLCTFSYCLSKKRYVKLPDFTFYIFMIEYTGDSNCGDYGMEPVKNRISTWPKVALKPNQAPKFISLYSTGESKFGQVYLKQKTNGIKMKYMTEYKNENTTSRSKLHKLENNLKHAYFQANHNHDGNNWVDLFRS